MPFSVKSIIYHKGKYMLQKRNNKKGIFYPGLYGLFGGRSDNSETPKKCIMRELKEELNLEFKFVKDILTLKIHSDDFEPKKSSVFKIYYFDCKLPINYKKNIMLSEGQKYDFYNIKKIDSLQMIPFDYAVLYYQFLYKVKKKKIIPKEYLKFNLAKG